MYCKSMRDAQFSSRSIMIALTDKQYEDDKEQGTCVKYYFVILSKSAPSKLNILYICTHIVVLILRSQFINTEMPTIL